LIELVNSNKDSVLVIVL